MAKCRICGYVRVDISRHIIFNHQMSCAEYKAVHGGSIVDASVDQRRRDTCEEIYGDPNYKNEEAKKLSNEVFERGHSLRDPAVREKGKQTKLKLYGDPNFTNRGKARKTCLDKYGVENVGQVKEIVDKRVQTNIKRYGRVFNYDYVPPFTKDELFDLHVNQGLTLGEMGLKYDLSAEGMGYWMKKYGIPVHKKIVIPKHKEFSSSQSSVEHFFKTCQEKNKVLSFYEYGHITESRYMLKLKRLFNAGKQYSHLRDELSEVALSPDKWPDFLKKLE